MIITKKLIELLGFYDSAFFVAGTTIETEGLTGRGSNFLAFTQKVTAYTNITEVYQNIPFYQYANVDPIYQNLTFVETVSAYRGGLVAQSIVFIEQGSAKLVKRLVKLDTIAFKEQTNVFKESSFYIQPTTPSISKSKYITLSHDTMSVTVRAPELGDSDKIDEVRINRLSRGGDLIIFSDPNWPKTESLSYRLSFLSAREIKKLKDFIHATIGLTILLVDYDGLHWSVIVTNPELEYDQSGKNNYTTTLEFEGLKL